jgi:DnaJ-class molecular chaperone
MKDCPDCVKGKVVVDNICPACRGRSFVLVNKIPNPCPNPNCNWGAVKGTETCFRCKGTGRIPD